MHINKEEHRTGNQKFDYASILYKDAEFGRVSRFTPTGDRTKKRETVLEKLNAFFSKF